MSISRIVIRTLIEESLRTAVDAGLVAVSRGSRRERRLAQVFAHAAPDRRRPVALTEHLSSTAELFEHFPYSSCVLLVAQWTAIGASVSVPQESSFSRTTDLLAGWDGVILVVPELGNVCVTQILHSRLAPRMSVILESDLRTLRFESELQRVVTSARTLPPSRTMQHPELMHGIMRLPASWQQLLHEALRSPDLWNIKRLHRACGVDRRTLQRQFRRAGLPAPAVVLGSSRRAADLAQVSTSASDAPERC